MKPIINAEKIERLFNDPYRFLNIFFAVLIVLIFVYAFFLAGKDAGINCQYKAIYGKECISCGFTRDFKTIISGGFNQAALINPSAVWIFGFFASQLIMRLSAIYASSKKWFK